MRLRYDPVEIITAPDPTIEIIKTASPAIEIVEDYYLLDE